MVPFLCLPFFLTASTFLIYTHIHGDPIQDPDNQLNAEKAFMTLALYNLLQIPLGFLPVIVNTLSAVLVDDSYYTYTYIIFKLKDYKLYFNLEIKDYNLQIHNISVFLTGPDWNKSSSNVSGTFRHQSK